jgi:hypothetical protein
MSTRITSLLGIGLFALAAGAAGCDFIEDIIDDIKDPEPTRCGTTVCGAGLTCCNPSCGICVPPGGVCSQQICEQPECRSNADCRAFSFMCTGCDCLALGRRDREPVCDGPGVQCLVDPCLNKQAVCDGGRCVIAPASSCGPGSVARRVCIECGPAGGCAQETDCARVCMQDSQCGMTQARCIDNVCQVQGCI